MKIEVVTAGVAAHQLRRDGHGGRQQNDGRACKPVQRGGLRSSAAVVETMGTRVLIGPDPCLFHGSSRSVCRVWAATAAGVKGSAKVVPP